MINKGKIINASHGWQWINHSVRYLVSNKLQWMMTFLVMGVFTVLLMSLSPVFQIALIFILPFVSSGLSLACADIEQGHKMSVNYLFKGFKSPNRINIFRYGFLVILMMLITQMVSSIVLNLIGISNEQLIQAMEQLRDNKEISVSIILSSDVLMKYFMVSIITMLPLLIINMLTPILLTFSNLTPAAAIKLSFLSGIRNASAFVLYGIIYLVFIVLVVFVLKFTVSTLITILGENSSIALIIYIIVFACFLTALASLAYCSAYVAFKDIFIGENT